MTDASPAAELRAALGPGLYDLLSTPAQQADAITVFRLIADVEGDHLARAWMVGMNPHLGDRAPLLVIRDGDTAAVIAAAHAYRGEAPPDVLHRALLMLAPDGRPIVQPRAGRRP
ncbi:hypothetical protein [Streptomyces sp. NPDC056682]|uniref:hypothetical protein n=1 Tax=Streptomyces sp. NPDC056682 TaxID=3345909 RepID=UPI0036B6A243